MEGKGEATYFVLAAQAREEKGRVLCEYSLVKVPLEKVEKALWILEGIDERRKNISELEEQEHEGFGGQAHFQIGRERGKLVRLKKELNDYLGKNAISTAGAIERGQQTFFEGDGIPSGALEAMLEKGILEPVKGKKERALSRAPRKILL